MSKKQVFIFVMVGILGFFLIKLLYHPLPKEVEINPSIVRVDKSNPKRMRLMVKKYNLKKGRYESEEDYLIKGVVYQPVKTGQAPPWHDNWMLSEDDPAHKARVDLNNNGKLDKNEREVGDFQLMKEMGVNTIRLYEPPGLSCGPDPNITTDKKTEAAKDILRELYSKYGIMTIVGHNLGTFLDYSNPEVRDQIYNEVMGVIKLYKNEPWVLMWNIGNENNIQQAGITDDFALNYYKETVQRIAHDIKEIDKNHPISISNMGLAGIYDFDKYCPDVDIYGANMYQSRNFSGLWNTASRINRPVYLTEFGCDALDSRANPRVPNEELQAEFIKKQWENISANHGGYAGTSLGGILFEWLDEWWKAPYDDSEIHTYEGGWDAPNFDSGTRESGNEEWWGICAQAEDGKDSPNFRHLRKVYYTLKELWNN